MHIMKECFVPFRVAFGLQKDSLYTNTFNLKINQLIEGGFIDKWISDEFDKVAKKAQVGLPAAGAKTGKIRDKKKKFKGKKKKEQELSDS